MSILQNTFGRKWAHLDTATT